MRRSAKRPSVGGPGHSTIRHAGRLGFKELNDRFGHPAGDAALAAVGHVAGGAVRAIDTMARFGGDEFAAILPVTDADGAFDFAERLRAEVSRCHDDDGQPLTMSFGAVEFPRDGQTREALVYAADRALYEAKALGRDRQASFIAARAARGAAPRP